MASSRNLTLNIVGDTSSLERALKGASGKTTGFGGKIQQLGKSMGRVGASMTKSLTLPIIAIGAGLVKVGLDFEKAKTTIRSGTGATGKNLDKLNKSFKKVFGTVPATMEDASTAIADLNTRTGATGEELEELTTQMLNLSRVTGTEVTPLISSMTRVFGDWDIATKNQGRSLDFLWKTSQTTGIAVDRLGKLIVDYGAPLRELGFSFEESAVMMGKFEKEGVNTEFVLGGRKQGLGRLAKAGKKPREEMFKLAKNIQKAGFTAENKQKSFEIFGARAGIDMGKAMEEGRLDLAALMADIDKSPETVDKAAKATLTFSERMDVLKNKAQLAIEPIGVDLVKSAEDMIPAFVDAIKKAASLLRKFSRLPKKVQANIVKFALFVVAAGPVIVILSTLTKAVYALATAFSFLAAHPLILLLAGIALVLVAGSKLTKMINEKMGPAFDYIAASAGMILGPFGMLGSMLQIVADNFDKIKSAAQTALDFINRVINRTPFWKKAPGAGGGGWQTPSGAPAGGWETPGWDTPQGMAEGGIVTRPTLALIGEAGPEAVIPLNLTRSIPEKERVVEVHHHYKVDYHIGTLIADDYGLKKLENKLRDFRIEEGLRLGLV